MWTRILDRWKKFPAGLRVLFLCLVLPFLGPGCANGLFFHPTSRMAPLPDTRGIASKPILFESLDGTELTGLWLPAQGEVKGTVLHVHGNAENLSTHVRFAEWLPAEGYNVFAFDYRGYGLSDGKPKRSGLVKDTQAALRTVSEMQAVQGRPLFVWGQSLGGTMSLQAMMREDLPVQGAVIDSTFYSYSFITAEKLKQLPWFLHFLRLFRPLLVSSGYDAATAVPELKDIPLAFLHGEADRVIPVGHSHKLKALAGENAILLTIPEARHCMAVLQMPEQVRPWILRFFEQNGSVHSSLNP